MINEKELAKSGSRSAEKAAAVRPAVGPAYRRENSRHVNDCLRSRAGSRAAEQMRSTNNAPSACFQKIGTTAKFDMNEINMPSQLVVGDMIAMRKLLLARGQLV